MTSSSQERQTATAGASRRDREELVRQLHDVLRGRVRMSASRFIDLVKAVNGAG